MVHMKKDYIPLLGDKISLNIIMLQGQNLSSSLFIFKLHLTLSRLEKTTGYQ